MGTMHIRSIYGRWNTTATVYRYLLEHAGEWLSSLEICHKFCVLNPSGVMSEINKQTTLDDDHEYMVGKCKRDGHHYYCLCRKSEQVRKAV